MVEVYGSMEGMVNGSNGLRHAVPQVDKGVARNRMACTDHRSLGGSR